MRPGFGVSIRASLQQRGEHWYQRDPIGFNPFQSAPHFSSEANVRSGGNLESGLPRFNPRLTSAARRTTPKEPEKPPKPSFNPRLTSAARRTPASASYLPLTTRFNPRLTSAARRTRRRSLNRSLTLSFNPRLTSAARRTAREATNTAIA